MEVFPLGNNMKILIPLERYTNKKFFEKENKSLKKNWHFVCLKEDLKNNNDYVSMEIFGFPITLQNFKGVIKAFINICPHRFSRIRSKSKGNGIFRCMYHGWTFNSDGIPYGIPMKEKLFNIKKKEIKSLKLKELKIDYCGNLIFVNLGVKKKLKEILGKYFKEIEMMSKSIGKEVKSNVYEYNANWKICVENTIEEYHVASTHPETFDKLLGREIKYDFDKSNSGVKIDSNKKFLEKWKPLEEKFSDRIYKINGYRHIFIYPLFTIATTMGTSFSLQSWQPIDINKTKITSRIFSFKLTKTMNKELISALDKSTNDFNNKVFDEDKDVTGNVQKGMEWNVNQSVFNSKGILGDNEQRIYYFHKVFLKENA